jgi:uncharacterized protein (TIGR03067 family)
MLIRLLPVIALFLGPIATGAPKDNAKAQKAERETIQGTWVATDCIVAGEKSSQKEVTGTRMLFRGDTIEYTLPDSGTEVIGPASKFSFVLDPSKKPKAIDLVPLDGLWKGLKMRGIYRIEGDTLTICFHDWSAESRPKEFAAPKGTTLVLMTLKRTKE